MRKIIILVGLISTALRLTAQGAIEFVQNKGQWDKQVKYRGQVNNGYFFIREKGFTILQFHPDDIKNSDTHFSGKSLTMNFRAHAWNVDFIPGRPQTKSTSFSEIVGEKKLSRYENYFIGDDSSKWASNCAVFESILIKSVYPNIDVRYYTEKGSLKYEIILHPGSKPQDIALQYVGLDEIKIKEKRLSLKIRFALFEESPPLTYQPGLDTRKTIASRYRLRDNVLRFDVAQYDSSKVVVIDPTFIFCQVTGSTAQNYGFTATYGPDGSSYGGGWVQASAGNFPNLNGYQVVNAGVEDIVLTRIPPMGGAPLWATFLGGSGLEQPHSLVADRQGNLYVAGRTNSPNFPVINNGSTWSGGGYDIIISKLSANGANLLGSRKIGGSGDDGVNANPVNNPDGTQLSLAQNYGDNGRSEIILDAVGNVLVTSQTRSIAGGGSNFPTLNAFQPTFGGGNQDAVLLKLSSNLNTVLFSSFLGGNGDDAGYVLSLHPINGNIYVAGGTRSTNFSLAPSGASLISSSFNGRIDGYVAIINATGSQRIATTFIGTPDIDQVFGIQFDARGYPYIMGQTLGNWQQFNITAPNVHVPNGRQFIAKLEPDLSSYVYSLAFGTIGGISSHYNISPVAFLVDRCENVYVSGWGDTWSAFSPGVGGGTFNLPAINALRPTTDGNDFYFFVLARDAAQVLYADFFGKNAPGERAGDHVDGGTSRFDKNGVIHQAVCANCLGGYRPSSTLCSGPVYNLAIVKIALNLAGVQSGVRSSINNVAGDTLGCVPLTVAFTDTVGNAQSYIWNFGDGSPDETTTTANNTHQYTAVGTYTVRLIAVDPTTCNGRDTSYIRIRVGNIEADLDFNPVKLPPCTAFNYRFDNLSTTLPGYPFRANSFVWNFGDGTPPVVAGPGPVNHPFAGPGTYNVRLYLQDTTYCNAPDSIVIPVSVAENVKSGFTTAARGCIPYQPVFTNTSLAAQTYWWNFGDGNTSTVASPSYTYTIPGTYTVTLAANNPNTCNLTDTSRFVVQVLDAPLTNFSFLPATVQPNTPYTFTNLASADAVRFKWNFGDGDSLLTSSRAAVVHQYRATGTFSACLTAYNSLDCPRTFCRDVQANVLPLVDLPNAFTPLSGDVNAVLKVRGFGISKMKFEIWNRWGQKVFESADQEQGWNGTYQGVVQPMDVYMYTLSVEFFDGSKASRKGDITLIR